MTAGAILRSYYGRAGQALEGVDPVRFALERERRVIDLTDQLWRLAPLAMTFGKALRGDDFLFDVMDGLEPASPTASSIYEAVIHSLRQIVDDAGDPRLEMLLAYDGARAGQLWATRPPEPHETERLEGMGLFQTRLLDRPYRFAAFVQHVEQLQSAHAPDVFFGATKAEPGRQVYAYWRTQRWTAADVTDVLSGRRP